MHPCHFPIHVLRTVAAGALSVTEDLVISAIVVGGTRVFAVSDLLAYCVKQVTLHN